MKLALLCNDYIQNLNYFVVMKKFILFILLIFSTLSANAENIFSGLTRLEKQILKQSYEYDLPQNRLERLETKLFGTCQSGDMEERYSVLKSAARNYRAYNPDIQYNNRRQIYNSYRPPIFTGTAGSNWRNTLWGNFMNQFAGMPTGLTPQLSQGMDPAYMDYFEAEREMMKNGFNEEYYQTPRGYRTTRTERGARTGVRLLD